MDKEALQVLIAIKTSLGEISFWMSILTIVQMCSMK